jgi:hypothetical protein
LKENQIAAKLLAVQGKPVDIGGYYQPDDAKASTALRPSKELNDTHGSVRMRFSSSPLLIPNAAKPAGPATGAVTEA